jgi:hypothetical protein
MPGPEAVAGILVLLLFGVVALAGLPDSRRAGSGTGQPSGSPGRTSAPSGAAPSAHPLQNEILAVLELDRRLLENRAELTKLLPPSAFKGADVAAVLRRANATVGEGLEPAGRLSLEPSTEVLGSKLELLYAGARTIANDALRAALSSSSYRVAAVAIVDAFAALPAIDAGLTALLAGPPPSASPSPSSGPIVSPRPTTSPPPKPSASPIRPSPSVSPSASPVATTGGQLLTNPGFETGIAPWRLVQAGPLDRATTGPDAALAGSGSQSLRVELDSTSGKPTGTAIRQAGLALEAGARYSVRVTVRASSTRDIRLRVIGPNEETFTVRLVTVGPNAAVATLGFTSLIDEPSAAFEIDLGGSTGTVWLDDAAFIRLAPG